MGLLENFKMAKESIVSNKLRSFLTMLGIIIGISSVIAILSLGAGGKASITGELEKIGSSSAQIKVDTQEASKGDYFTLKDVDYLKEKGENIKYASASASRQSTIRYKDKGKRAYMTGSNEDMKYVQNSEILYGRFFNEKEVEDGKDVIVIDDITASYLFGYKDAVDETITLGKDANIKKFKIVGVTKSASYMGGSFNDQMPAMVNVPITALRNMYDDLSIDNIYIVSNSKETTEDAINESLNILSSKHNNRGEDLYSGEKLLKQVDQVNKIIDIFTSFIGAVAAISLVVGGIGVMNIMLVSVTERTREIGIRKAIGATTNAILIQFLTESVIISLIGGLIGMIFGIMGAYAIGSYADVTPVLSLRDIILVILFSSSVGIFFGIYPARKAAKLDPIDALRYE
ncbi:ABC transporter permease [Clostridium sp. 'White wine YQ']|uniref:ABC transporter permease n=1 Tax=Clostridium sp. 'White wine YQ' TaxID=3027474 RepID=UPI002366CD69|nr:ABC transporter permease [Clostridium sp. 'White wine YQ']MDD7792921.1 ABC transporter permease [Clostridium sp. 'White wine YQ']